MFSGTVGDLTAPSQLTRGNLLSQSAAWNLAGFVIPTLVAVFTIPILARGLGTERLGFLTLAWVLIGAFSLFDLGWGRALTQVVASMIGRADDADLGSVAWTTILLMLVWGVLVAMALLIGSIWLVHTLLRVPMWLQGEATRSLQALSVGIPIVIVTSGLRGVLEAYQRFQLSNLIRIPLGALTFAGPLIVLPFTQSLTAVVAVLLLARLGALLAYGLGCLRTLPTAYRRFFRFRLGQTVPVLRLGAWISISNFISPLMLYLDRFVVGAIVSVAAVAFYAVPYDVSTRFLVIPTAIAGVLFPAFATSFTSESARTTQLYTRGVKVVLLTFFPIGLMAVAFASDGLRLWLGPGFAHSSTRVLQLLAVGVFCNGLAQIPFALIQGIGRADVSAKLHVVEAAFYVPVMILLIHRFGINGAAIAWTTRSAVDMTALLALGFVHLNVEPRSVYSLGAWVGGAAVLIVFAATLEGIMRPVYVVVAILAYGIASWFWLLSSADRTLALRLRARLTGVRL